MCLVDMDVDHGDCDYVSQFVCSLQKHCEIVDGSFEIKNVSGGDLWWCVQGGSVATKLEDQETLEASVDEGDLSCDGKGEGILFMFRTTATCAGPFVAYYGYDCTTCPNTKEKE